MRLSRVSRPPERSVDSTPGLAFLSARERPMRTASDWPCGPPPSTWQNTSYCAAVAVAWSDADAGDRGLAAAEAPNELSLRHVVRCGIGGAGALLGGDLDLLGSDLLRLDLHRLLRAVRMLEAGIDLEAPQHVVPQARL